MTGRGAILGAGLGALIATMALAVETLAVEARAARVLAIGDIHGDHPALVEILRSAGLIDEDLHWSGGEAVLVQTGDFLDRGRDVLAVMDLLRRLEVEAAAQGGRVVVLLGNHEAMNLLGFYRDVNPAVYADFVDAESLAVQDGAWQAHRRWVRANGRTLEPALATDAEAERVWREQHPPGFVEYVMALSPQGEYGAWVRGLPIVHREDDVIFVHGGIAPALTELSLEQLNQRAHQEVTRLDRCRAVLIEAEIIVETTDPMTMVAHGTLEHQALTRRLERASEPMEAALRERQRLLDQCLDYQQWFLVDEDGPLWYRGYARLDEAAGRPVVEGVLAAYGAKHLVVGHTPQRSSTVETRFGGRVVLIDTGMLSEVYGGRPSALEIEDGVFAAVYSDHRVPLDISSPPGGASKMRFVGPTGEPLPFAGEDQILELLESGRFVEARRLTEGINRPYRVLLERDGIELSGIFREVDVILHMHRLSDGRLVPALRDSYRYEPAAYRLSRLIGLDRVPPAVLRSFERRAGSLQLWVHGAMDEATRQKEGLEPPSPLAWSQEVAMRRFFDALIFNIDRNTGNILVDRDSWRLWLVDHTRSFAPVTELRSLDEVQRCARPVFEAVSALDRARLEQELSPMLDRAELDALEARRLLLVEHLRSLIARRGEQAVLFPWPE